MCVIITHRCKWNQCLSEGLWDLEFGRQSVFRRGRPLVVTEGDCGTGSRDRAPSLRATPGARMLATTGSTTWSRSRLVRVV